MGCRRVAHFGARNNVGENVAAFGPVLKLAAQGFKFRFIQAAFQALPARLDADVFEVRRRLVDLGKFASPGCEHCRRRALAARREGASLKILVTAKLRVSLERGTWGRR